MGEGRAAGRKEPQEGRAAQEGKAAGGKSDRQEGDRQGEGGRREVMTGGDATLFNLKRVPHHWGVVGKWGQKKR